MDTVGVGLARGSLRRVDRGGGDQSLEGGEVILLHDSDAYSAAGSWRATAAAVPEICRLLRQAELVAAPFCDATATVRD